MKDWRHLLAAMIVQNEVRAAFESMTTKNHVTYALIHHGDKHNDLPSVCQVPQLEYCQCPWLIRFLAAARDHRQTWWIKRAASCCL
jgi:hypothetical protein